MIGEARHTNSSFELEIRGTAVASRKTKMEFSRKNDATFSRFVSSLRLMKDILIAGKGGIFVDEFGCNSNLTLRTVVHSRHYIIDFASLK